MKNPPRMRVVPKITRPFLLFSLTVIGCLGLNIVSIRKQGSKYYPRAYGKRKLDAVIKSILINFDFVMLWNDFNFYQNSGNLKKQKYWFDLQKCIYIKLFQNK